MRHRPVPSRFIIGRYPPSLYLDFVNEGFGQGQGALVSYGGNANCPQSGDISNLDWFDASNFTVFVHLKFSSAVGFQAITSVDDGTGNNISAEIQWDGNQFLAVTSVAGVVNAPGFGSGVNTANEIRVCYGFADGQKAYSVNGANPIKTSIATFPSGLTTARLGRRITTHNFNGSLIRVAMWKANLPDQAMARLTAL